MTENKLTPEQAVEEIYTRPPMYRTKEALRKIIDRIEPDNSEIERAISSLCPERFVECVQIHGGRDECEIEKCKVRDVLKLLRGEG